MKVQRCKMRVLSFSGIGSLLLVGYLALTIKHFYDASLPEVDLSFAYDLPRAFVTSLPPAIRHASRAQELRHQKLHARYVHVVIFPSRFSVWNNHKNNSPQLSKYSLHVISPLTKLMTLPPNNTYSLLGTNASVATSSKLITEPTPKRYEIYVKRLLKMRVVTEYFDFPVDKLPPDVYDLMTIDSHNLQYAPFHYAEDAWLLKSDYTPLNVTHPPSVAAASTDPLSSLPITISVRSATLGWMRLSKEFEASVKMIGAIGKLASGSDSKQVQQVLSKIASGEVSNLPDTEDEDDEEQENFKKMFLTVNPWLLLLTFVVSFFHLVFDILSIKNDIQYWRSKQSFVGLSSKSLILQFIMRAIILLYLIDNEASSLVLFSVGSSFIMTAWKLIKILRVGFSYYKVPLLPLHFPMISFGDRTEEEQATQQYDDIALKWMFYALFPLVLIWSAYTLLYDTHKSWYSWALSSAASAVYAAGFCLMLPQLYINYKLKSVAHLPWRAFMYKTFNTFIDDLFAFIIPQPTMSRVATFRDDIVFFIYLYQRWLYPVDMSRSYGKKPATAASVAATSAETDAAPASATNVENTPSPQNDEAQREGVVPDTLHHRHPHPVEGQTTQ